MAQTVKRLPTMQVDLGSIPGLGKSSGEGIGNLLQDACLGNPMDRGAWRAAVHSVAESDTTELTHMPPPKESIMYVCFLPPNLPRL